jgi:two-component system LytT family response regulator
MSLRAVVVDDEPLGRRGVVGRLEKSGRVEVVAQCANGRQAIEAVRRHRPELLFLDVQMPGLDGFQVVEALPEARRPHVVFVTAYDRHAVRAFEVHALDYLVKPIDDDRFDEALARAIRAVEQERDSDLGRRVAAAVGDLRGGPGPPQAAPGGPANCFPVRAKGKVTFVRHADIEWVGAEGDYVRLHAGPRSYLIHETLASVERGLGSRRFLRIHRSTIVNLDRVRELESLENGDHEVRLNDGTRLRLSRTYRDAAARLTRRG